MVFDGLEPNSENAKGSPWKARNSIKDAVRYVTIMLETFVEFMSGHFSITKGDFGSTRPDVWGFRSHFTHNKRPREAGKKKERKIPK
jgi:hypothetical protein